MFVEEKNALSEEIESYVNKYGNDRSALLMILHEIQNKHRHISEFAQQEVARLLNIHPVEVYSVISFFAFLNSNPKGRNLVRICQTISCDMKGKSALIKAIERELGIKIGETTKDNKFTIEYANCLGLCDVGPAMAINDRVSTNLLRKKLLNFLER